MLTLRAQNEIHYYLGSASLTVHYTAKHFTYLDCKNNNTFG